MANRNKKIVPELSQEALDKCADAPDTLRFRNGKIVHADDSDSTAYLETWAKETSISVDTPINIIPRELFIKLLVQASKYRLRWCSFCGKSQTQIEHLIAGPDINICNECIALSNEILAEAKQPANA